MMLVFELSMPGVNSWNGEWSGEGNLYAKVVSVRDIAKAGAILVYGPYSYNFGDGWRAEVSVRAADGREVAGVRRRSRGFHGYDWMVNSIIEHRRIQAETTRQ